MSMYAFGIEEVVAGKAGEIQHRDREFYRVQPHLRSRLHVSTKILILPTVSDL
jgi:hypothetical protein